MIYVDTSVALAQLLAEDRIPPAELWTKTLVCSRLLEYELWTRLHARGLAVLMVSRPGFSVADWLFSNSSRTS